jgi:uncharacterized protein (DUF433 family)
MHKHYIVKSDNMVQKFPAVCLGEINIANRYIWVKTVFGMIDGQVVKSSIFEAFAE